MGVSYDRICVCHSFQERNLQEMENDDGGNELSLQDDEERDEIAVDHFICIFEHLKKFTLLIEPQKLVIPMKFVMN